jgi:hypothetical protein
MAEYNDVRNAEARWKDVGSGVLSKDGKSEFVVILQQSAGLPLRVVSAAELGDARQYTRADLVSPTPEAVKETLTNIRQQSALRFAAIPVFVAIFGALAAAHYYKPATGAELQEQGKILLPVLGLATAFWFSVVEMFLSRNLIRWWKSLETLPSGWDTIVAHRKDDYLVDLLRLVLFLPYASAMSFWLWKTDLFGSKSLVIGLAWGVVVTGAASWLWYSSRGRNLPCFVMGWLGVVVLASIIGWRFH